jgi:hypothetical protein
VIGQVCASRHIKRELIRGMWKKSRRQLVFRDRRVRSAAFCLSGSNRISASRRPMIKRSRAGRLALRHHAAAGGQPGGFFICGNAKRRRYSRGSFYRRAATWRQVL